MGNGRPAYQQVADDLRSRINDGELQEGDQLPTEAQLGEDYGVSRIVVRNALDQLRTEGLVTSQRGKGTFVRQQKPLERRLVGHLYAERATSSPFATAARAAGAEPEWDYQSRRTTATKAIATRLAIEPSDPVMRTTYRFYADREPVMLSTSYEPLAITDGTPIEHPEASPTTGVVARMDLIGQHITHVVEDVRARPPHPSETEALQIPTGVPIFAIERTYYANQLPVETADITISAHRYTLTYAVPIPEAGS